MQSSPGLASSGRAPAPKWRMRGPIRRRPLRASRSSRRAPAPTPSSRAVPPAPVASAPQKPVAPPAPKPRIHDAGRARSLRGRRTPPDADRSRARRREIDRRHQQLDGRDPVRGIRPRHAERGARVVGLVRNERGRNRRRERSGESEAGSAAGSENCRGACVRRRAGSVRLSRPWPRRAARADRRRPTVQRRQTQDARARARLPRERAIHAGLRGYPSVCSAAAISSRIAGSSIVAGVVHGSAFAIRRITPRNDLARPRLRQSFHDCGRLERGHGSDTLAHRGDRLGDDLLGRPSAGRIHDEETDRHLAFERRRAPRTRRTPRRRAEPRAPPPSRRSRADGPRR